jgi:hypothetical protein
MLQFPKTEDPLVAALQRLIQREGGYIAVADKIDASDQSLYQIAQLKPHSTSKRLKSVGPSLRKRLDQAFPDWLSGVVDKLGSDTQTHDDLIGSASPPIQTATAGAERFTLAAALERLGAELAQDMPNEVREDVADALHKMAMRRGATRDQKQVASLLGAALASAAAPTARKLLEATATVESSQLHQKRTQP